MLGIFVCVIVNCSTFNTQMFIGVVSLRRVCSECLDLRYVMNISYNLKPYNVPPVS